MNGKRPTEIQEDSGVETVVETSMGDIAIRPMDEHYIFAGDVSQANFFGQNGHCVSDGTIDPDVAKPSLLFGTIHKALLEEYDLPPILAWHDDKIVGFLNYYPEGMFDKPVCLLEDDLARSVRVNREGLPEAKTDTLRMACLTIAPEYRHQGIATALVRHLQERISGTQWNNLHAECFADNHPNRWRPQLSFWKRLGFKVIREPSEQTQSVEREMWRSISEKTGCDIESRCSNVTMGKYLVQYTTTA